MVALLVALVTTPAAAGTQIELLGGAAVVWASSEGQVHPIGQAALRSRWSREGSRWGLVVGAAGPVYLGEPAPVHVTQELVWGHTPQVLDLYGSVLGAYTVLRAERASWQASLDLELGLAAGSRSGWRSGLCHDDPCSLSPLYPSYGRVPVLAAATGASTALVLGRGLTLRVGVDILAYRGEERAPVPFPSPHHTLDVDAHPWVGLGWQLTTRRRPIQDPCADL